MAAKETVGLVGTGIMGAPMATNLAKAAEERRVPLAVTSMARQYYTALEADGLGEEGTQALIKAVEKLAGIQVRQQG